MSDKPETIDLVVAATERKPYEFSQAFNTLMADRLQAAIENKKAELANTNFDKSE